MKIGVISDIHGNAPALDAILDALGNVDLLLCAGDITGYYPLVNEVCERLQNIKAKVVIGNHDHWMLSNKKDVLPEIEQSIEMTKKLLSDENRQWLSTLTALKWIDIPECPILLCHGSPWNPLEEYIYSDYKNFDAFTKLGAKIIIMGHTHWAMEKRISDCLIVNSGSVGQPRDKDSRPCCCKINLDTMVVEFIRVQYDPSEVLKACNKYNVPERIQNYLRGF